MTEPVNQTQLDRERDARDKLLDQLRTNLEGKISEINRTAHDIAIRMAGLAAKMDTVSADVTDLRRISHDYSLKMQVVANLQEEIKYINDAVLEVKQSGDALGKQVDEDMTKRTERMSNARWFVGTVIGVVSFIGTILAIWSQLHG